MCEDFNMTYARIANNHQGQVPGRTVGNVVHSLENDIDQKVDDAIESFLRTLSQIGPELLSGCLTVSFFERRATRQLFGLVSHEERVVFEQWVIRVVVNNTPRPISNDSAALMERQRMQVRLLQTLAGLVCVLQCDNDPPHYTSLLIRIPLKECFDQS